MELMDVFESVVDSGLEQETVLVHCSEADTVLQPGV
jgi:protein tyrosine phosphatase